MSLPNSYKQYFDELSEVSNEKSYKVKCKLSPCKNSEKNKPFCVAKSSTCTLRRHLSVIEITFTSESLSHNIN